MRQFGHRARLAAACTIAAVAALASQATAAASAATVGEIEGAGVAGAIPDSYLVQLRDDVVGAADVTTTAASLAGAHGGRVTATYRHALRGFAVRMPAAAAKRLAADPAVARVAQDARAVVPLGTQPGPPSWGLDRIDQRNLPLDNVYNYPNTASNVRAYVIGTGIRTTHTDFGGRAVWGVNITGDGQNTDCNGHGTHVAGTVGGARYGVAKAVTLVAVKVLGCSGSGSWSWVVAGIDWVTGNHQPGQPAVANLSLGGAPNTVVDNAVRTSIADGIVYAVSAGGSNVDACGVSPARVVEALTVAASAPNDSRPSASNYGPCVDIFAPGLSIPSTYHLSDTATAVLNGTSMAAAHVTGGAALYYSVTPAAPAADVAARVLANATLNKITNPGPGTPNRLLYVGTVTR